MKSNGEWNLREITLKNNLKNPKKVTKSFRWLFIKLNNRFARESKSLKTQSFVYLLNFQTLIAHEYCERKDLNNEKWN